jgi:beta-lactamase superfamily II metal-dependent hydrolase
MRKSVAAAITPILALGLLSACASMQGSGSPGTQERGSEVDPDELYEQMVQDEILTVAPARVPAAVPLADGGTVEFYVFKMGQADAMLVVGPAPARKTLLVDTGELNWNSRKGCGHVRERVMQITGSARVDYFVLTHYHLDHSGSPRSVNASGRETAGGGLFCLLDGGSAFFRIGTLITPGDDEAPFDPTRQNSHKAIIDGIESWKSTGSLGERVVANFAPNLIDLGAGVKIEILSVDGEVFDGDLGALAAVAQDHPGLYRVGSEASPNDFSIGMEISVGNFELFTAGDLSGAPGEAPYPEYIKTGHEQIYTNVESHMVNHWKSSSREANVEVYRANHHGSGNSSTEDLANMLKPEIVIYSSGGKHGHPDRSIVDRFELLGSDQVVISSVDTSDHAWPDGFPERYGNGWDNPTGELLIEVPIGGTEFEVKTATQSFLYPIKSDAQEATE